MRVLHLIASLQGGGAERQLVHLAGGLRHRRCDVHVASLQGGTHLARLAATGVTIHRLAARSNYDPRIATAIVRLIRRIRPDVLQTWLPQMDVFGGIASIVTRTPWVISERSSSAHRRGTMRMTCRHLLGRWASAVVANSEPGLEWWTRTRVPRHVVPNAVDFAELNAAPLDPVDYGASALVLFAGRLVPEKNADTLVAALRHVVAQRDIVALLCGVGPLEPAVRAAVAEAAGGDRIRLLGFHENLPGLMKRAAVLVAPSRFEGHPNVPIEAAAVGCPLVVSDIPAHRGWLDERSAMFAPPGDPKALAHAILQVLDDPIDAGRRAGAARAAVREWTIERAAAAYLSIYRDLAPRADVAACGL